MKATIYCVALIIFSVLLTFCGPSKGDSDDPAKGSIEVIEAFPKLTFNRPVDLQQPKDNSNRLFVVEQPGIISVFENDMGATNKKTFLDIQSKVDDSGNEQGLLGLAFHPDYKNNGYFFVNYTASDPDRTVIARYKVSSNSNQADAASEYVLLTFKQPYSNHNGGQVSFGPDEFLYIAVGDGGSGGDPQGNGQNRATLLGSILRIDVNKEESGLRYAIPSDNPFANNTSGFRKEIYAYGMRNPWRFSFDAVTGKLWAGDVGQNSYEEVDIIENGGNYGWNKMEGKHCYKSNCKIEGLILPVWEYSRSEGVSITGGFVYRGKALRSLQGKYIFADYGSSTIWSLDADKPGDAVELFNASFPISSFGVDTQNEIFVCGFDGKIHKFKE